MADWAVDHREMARLEHLQTRLSQGSNGIMEKISHLPHVDLRQFQLLQQQ
jgi:hypothetical protein